MSDLTEVEQEELRLLREFWDLYWNGPSTVEFEDKFGNYFSGYENDGTEQGLDEAAGAVEDHYAEHDYWPPSKF